MYSPYYLKVSYAQELLREGGSKLDVEIFRKKFNALFWNCVWYFSLNDLCYDFVLPYKRNIETSDYKTVIQDMTNQTFFSSSSCSITSPPAKLTNCKATNRNRSYLDNLCVDSQVVNIYLNNPGRRNLKKLSYKVSVDEIVPEVSISQSSLINPNLFADTSSSCRSSEATPKTEPLSDVPRRLLSVSSSYLSSIHNQSDLPVRQHNKSMDQLTLIKSDLDTSEGLLDNIEEDKYSLLISVEKWT